MTSKCAGIQYWIGSVRRMVILPKCHTGSFLSASWSFHVCGMLLMQRRFWMPFAYSSLFVVIMPPSPHVVMFLSEWNENAPQSPMEPALRPL